MSPLTLDALQLVDAIDRRGSFAGAAAELGRVPSAVTYAVRKLEDDLDDCCARAATCWPRPTSWRAGCAAWPQAGSRS